MCDFIDIKGEKEAGHSRVHAEWFNIYEIQKQANPVWW